MSSPTCIEEYVLDLLAAIARNAAGNPPEMPFEPVDEPDELRGGLLDGEEQERKC